MRLRPWLMLGVLSFSLPACVAVAAPAALAKQTHMVPMADGAKLATDVYLPAGEGPWPVVFSRTPYNKNGAGGAGYAAAGAVAVVQDMRGRFASQGENLPFIGCGWGEHHDGAETVAWILKQPWCNGRIATIGGSAGGITQNLLAGTGAKGLVAQYIVVAAGSLYHHAAYVGGALRKNQVENWLKGNRFDPNAEKVYSAHPAYDEYWQQFDLSRKVGEVTAPAVHVGGWFDTFALGTVSSYVWRQHQGGAGAKGTQKLVMGPWGHGGASGGGQIGELKFPRSGLPRGYESGAWLICWLKNGGAGAEKLRNVAYYVMGDTADAKAPGNEWRFADDWPIPAEPTTYYLHADGGPSLSREKPVPAVAPGAPSAVMSYKFDPADPCPTVGGGNLSLPAGPMDQNRIEKRKDVLCFTSEPLAAPLEVTGQVKAKLFVSCSAADTDLSVRFCDVYPDGKSYLMAEGMLRLRYRGGFDKPRPLVPGEVAEVEVELWPTSIVLNTGHRIRLTVTSSNFPRFDVNPGTGEPMRPGGKTVVQTNHIICGPQRCSAVVLPVVAPKS